MFQCYFDLQHGCDNPSTVQAKGVLPGKLIFITLILYIRYTYISFM